MPGSRVLIAINLLSDSDTHLVLDIPRLRAVMLKFICTRDVIGNLIGYCVSGIVMLQSRRIYNHRSMLSGSIRVELNTPQN